MGSFQGLCGTHPLCIVHRCVRSCTSESRGKRVSNLPMGAMGTFEHMSTHIDGEASREFEPEQLHDAPRPRADVQHTTRTRGARLRVQHDRACHGRLDDHAPGDSELGAEVVGAGGKDNVADGWAGECTGQAGAASHCRLQLTAVAGHRMLVQPGSVAGLGAGEHAVQCKESEGNLQLMFLSRPRPSARRLRKTMMPCHERSHQHAPPQHQLSWIEYAAAVQIMSRRNGKASRRHRKASRRQPKERRRRQKAS